MVVPRQKSFSQVMLAFLRKAETLEPKFADFASCLSEHGCGSSCSSLLLLVFVAQDDGGLFVSTKALLLFGDTVVSCKRERI